MCIIKTFFGICPNESLVSNNKGIPLFKKKYFQLFLEMRHSDPKKFLIKINKGIPLFIFCCIFKSINNSHLRMQNQRQNIFTSVQNYISLQLKITSIHFFFFSLCYIDTYGVVYYGQTHNS